VTLDTSVIIAGLMSSSGGSAKIIQACDSELSCAVSDSTEGEIARNVDKLGGVLLTNFKALLSTRTIGFVKPSPASVDKFTSFTDPDDAHLLAACEEWDADYLVSLNRKHLLDNEKAHTATKARVVSPGDLILLLGL